jgi:DNA polymerase-3 subunit beta
MGAFLCRLNSDCRQGVDQTALVLPHRQTQFVTMKFTINSKALLTVVSALSAAVSPAPVVPALSCILFDLEDKKLRFAASDLGNTIKGTILVDAPASEKGSVCLPARLLLDTLKNLAGELVTVTVDLKTLKTTLSTTSGEYRMAGVTHQDFPVLPEPENPRVATLTRAFMTDVLNATIFCTGDDEIRQALTCINLELKKDAVSAVSSDGHALSLVNKSVETSASDYIQMLLPRKSAGILLGLLDRSSADNVQLSRSGSHVFFEFGQVSFIARLVDERYPDVKLVLPKTNSIRIDIAMDALLGSLRRMNAFTDSTRVVVMNTVGQELRIAASNEGHGNSAYETIPCDHTGDDLTIGFNVSKLMNILSHVKAKTVTLTFLSERSAAEIYDSETRDKHLMILMPVMVNTAQAA